MRTTFLILVALFTIGQMAFSQGRKEPAKKARVSVNESRLRHIRHLFSSYPHIVLPFVYKTQGSLLVTDISSDNDKDILIFGEDSPVFIIGTMSDTSNYFCFFYLLPADDAIPSVVIFDKSGQQIVQKQLAESCWQGCESDCISIVTIQPDLNIVFDYREFLFDFDDEKDYCEEMPYKARGYIEKSRISTNGKWELIEKIALKESELMKNPIVHYHTKD